jgi:hypothetical protein
MRKLKNWSARRAGGRITLKAHDAKTGEPLTIVGIETITRWGGQKNPIATHVGGDQFELA